MKTLANDIFFAQVEADIANGRAVSFRIKGISMYPLLRSGKDAVILDRCDSEQLQPLDVVLFRYNGKHLLHRIIARDGNQLIIKGDGSIVATEHCLTTDVVGKVTHIIRHSSTPLPITSLRWTIPSKLWQLTPTILRRLVLRFATRL